MGLFDNLYKYMGEERARGARARELGAQKAEALTEKFVGPLRKEGFEAAFHPKKLERAKTEWEAKAEIARKGLEAKKKWTKEQLRYKTELEKELIEKRRKEKEEYLKFKRGKITGRKDVMVSKGGIVVLSPVEMSITNRTDYKAARDNMKTIVLGKYTKILPAKKVKSLIGGIAIGHAQIHNAHKDDCGTFTSEVLRELNGIGDIYAKSKEKIGSFFLRRMNSVNELKTSGERNRALMKFIIDIKRMKTDKYKKDFFGSMGSVMWGKIYRNNKFPLKTTKSYGVIDKELRSMANIEITSDKHKEVLSNYDTFLNNKLKEVKKNIKPIGLKKVKIHKLAAKTITGSIINFVKATKDYLLSKPNVKNLFKSEFGQNYMFKRIKDPLDIEKMVNRKKIKYKKVEDRKNYRISEYKKWAQGQIMLGELKDDVDHIKKWIRWAIKHKLNLGLY